MDSRTVQCPSCGTSLQIKANQVGRRGKCPNCGEVFSLGERGVPPAGIPAANPQAARAGSPESAKGKWAQEKPVRARADGSGSEPDRAVPAATPASANALTWKCPSCGAQRPKDAAVCVLCGYNANTRQRLRTDLTPEAKVGGSDEHPDVSDNRYKVFCGLAITASVCTGLGAVGWLLGFFGPFRGLLPLAALVSIGLVLAIAAALAGRRVPKSDGLVRIGRLTLVVGVVLTLMSFLLPGLLRARELTKRLVCRVNLKNIGLSCHEYAKSYGNGAFPLDLETIASLGLCTELQFCCPSVERHLGDFHGSYEYITGQGLRDKSSNVLAYDKPPNHTGQGQDEQSTMCGGNVLFVDGRVEFVAPYARVRELVEQTMRRLGRPPPNRQAGASSGPRNEVTPRTRQKARPTAGGGSASRRGPAVTRRGKAPSHRGGGGGVVDDGTARSIKITHPTSGSYQEGSVIMIRWESVGNIPEVRIELQCPQRTRVRRRRAWYIERLITPSTRNTGEYRWVVPDGLRPSDDYSIRVRDADDASVYDVSPNIGVGG